MLHCSIWNLYVSLKRSRWSAGRSRSHDIEPTFRAWRQEILNSRRPKEEYFMDKNTETTAPKLASIPQMDAPQAFREMAEKGTTHAKETYEKINAATTSSGRFDQKQLFDGG